MQRIVLPLLASLGGRRGLLPYYDRHFEPGEIEEILTHSASHRRGPATRCLAPESAAAWSTTGALPLAGVPNPGLGERAESRWSPPDGEGMLLYPTARTATR